MTIKDLYNWAMKYGVEDAKLVVADDDYLSGVVLYYPNEDSLDRVLTTEGETVRIYL